MENPKDLTPRQLERAVDDRVFDSWDGSDRIVGPKTKSPKLSELYLHVGVFKKDLPDPGINRGMFDTDIISEVLAYLGLAKKYDPPACRKAGEKAYVRARLDKPGDAIILDWLDVKGKWAPYNYIDFETFNNKPDPNTVAKAYRKADTAWARACDEWNAEL
ncbi:hypothetical protein PFICI_02865 [Pestalotiopsis fici W106-1]|uniref:Uncharacterized protein n=1 Tax=Pestalotiopsis fici (strain W106-1 / CGMCC3.15140) TaxID=1229662 RepID=W3XFN0_PESFW|nr:uncharacterized protein PFICI_02865 [Pestalotiopsis fici W106-1]ETS84840.1 hypothetical protein PFICI_02865 [Pestalotiopsis fici W106-1]